MTQNSMSQNKKSRDTIAQTLLVATVLCVVCSVLVASAAVGLRGRQEANKRLDKKKNVLIAAELFNKKEQADAEIDGIFETSIERVLIDLETGETLDPSVVDPTTYDPREASRNPELSMPIEPTSKLGGIKRREKYAFVYRVKGHSGETTGQITKVVLPIYGKGLWSTLYGFIAISVDGTTIEGITFYQHGETPGLGAEIENPNWQGLWKGKQLFDKDEEIAITVIKGAVNASKHQVDGLSGATITCNGVTQLVRYWMGPEGFGPYLEKLRQTGGSHG